MVKAEHRIYPDYALAVAWLRGPVTAADFIGEVNRLYFDPVWKEGYFTLWDLKAVTHFVVDPVDMNRIHTVLRDLRPKRGPGLLAFAVSRPQDWDLCYLIAETEPLRLRPARVFWSTDEALKWMGVSFPPPGPLPS